MEPKESNRVKTTFTFSDLRRRYESLTSSIFCDCTVVTKFVGGVPADEKALRSFVKHHLNRDRVMSEQEIEDAVHRIMTKEVGERDVTPETGEVKEQTIYGVNIIRRDEHGPYLGDWMIKANIKQAASRARLFQQIRGTKGDFAEAGRVTATGVSLRDEKWPQKIYIVNADGSGPAETYFEPFMGRVQTPQGPVSILHHSECIRPGSRFAFEFRFMAGKTKVEDIGDVMSFSMLMGLGSVRSMECGKFSIDHCEIEMVKDLKRGDGKDKDKEEKPERKRIDVKERVDSDSVEQTEEKAEERESAVAASN